VKPVEKDEDGRPQFDNDNQHPNLVGLGRNDVHDLLHLLAGHWLIWVHPRLAIVLNAQIESRSAGPFEEKSGAIITDLGILEPDGVPQGLIVDGYVTPTPANPGQTKP
jgi:hypothetical protein